jgi:hypothetical protein
MVRRSSIRGLLWHERRKRKAMMRENDLYILFFTCIFFSCPLVHPGIPEGNASVRGRLDGLVGSSVSPWEYF